MAITPDRIEELFNLVREADLPTFLALDCKLHLLLEEKAATLPPPGHSATPQEEFFQRYPPVAVDPDLFALVGIHPENPVEENKPPIRESMSWRFTG
ncbi:MAG: hypothetical protein ACE5JO_09755 [Candidatus Binatia bacterium]